MPAVISLSDLQSFYSARLVLQIFCDDGGSQPGPRLATALQTATDKGAAILGKVDVWQSLDAVKMLVDEDASIRLAFCQFAMAIGAEAKPEFHGGETGQSRAWWNLGKEALKDMVASRTKSRAEAFTGSNTTTKPRVANARQFEFARRRDKDSSGGF